MYLRHFKSAFRKVRMKQILSMSNVSLLYVGKTVEIYFTYGMLLSLDELQPLDLPSIPSTPLTQVYQNLIMIYICIYVIFRFYIIATYLYIMQLLHYVMIFIRLRLLPTRYRLRRMMIKKIFLKMCYQCRRQR